jgi:hypothetical protein
MSMDEFQTITAGKVALETPQHSKHRVPSPEEYVQIANDADGRVQPPHQQAVFFCVYVCVCDGGGNVLPKVKMTILK